MAQIDDELAALEAQAAANESAEDSAVIVLNGIQARIDAAVAAATAAGATPAQLQAITDLQAALKAHGDPLAAAVAAQPAPAPAPTPAPASKAHPGNS